MSLFRGGHWCSLSHGIHPYFIGFLRVVLTFLLSVGDIFRLAWGGISIFFLIRSSAFASGFGVIFGIGFIWMASVLDRGDALFLRFRGGNLYVLSRDIYACVFRFLRIVKSFPRPNTPDSRARPDCQAHRKSLLLSA